MRKIITIGLIGLIFLSLTGCNVQPRVASVPPLDVIIETDIVRIEAEGNSITVTVIETGRIAKFTRTVRVTNSDEPVTQRTFVSCEIIGISSRGGAFVVVEWETQRIHIIGRG